MPCYEFQSDSPSGPPWSSGFASEADCLQACGEGACCNGTTCTVKPQCQCNAAAGEVFKGVGTVCSPNPCLCCGTTDTPEHLMLTISSFNWYQASPPPIPASQVNGDYLISRIGNAYPLCINWEMYDRPTIGGWSLSCSYSNRFPNSDNFDVGIRVGSAGMSMYLRGQNTLGYVSCFFSEFFYQAQELKGQFFCGATETISGIAGGVSGTAIPTPVARFNWTIAPVYTNPLP
jgi:hypothetical protein